MTASIKVRDCWRRASHLRGSYNHKRKCLEDQFLGMVSGRKSQKQSSASSPSTRPRSQAHFLAVSSLTSDSASSTVQRANYLDCHQQKQACAAEPAPFQFPGVTPSSLALHGGDVVGERLPFARPQTNINAFGGRTSVVGLPWSDNVTGGKLHGSYSGPVDDQMRPHGEGSLVLQNNRFLRFHGRWARGDLVSPLRNDDEGRAKGVHSNSCHETQGQGQDNPSKGCGGKPIMPMKSTYSDLCEDLVGGSLVERPTESFGASQNRRLCEPRYRPGQVARTTRHMVIRGTDEAAARSASSLKIYHRAFLKRPNGLWTCSILVDRALQPADGVGSRWYDGDEIDRDAMSLEECMLFVVDEDGSTEIVRRELCGKVVRRIRTCNGNKAGGCLAQAPRGGRGGSSERLHG